MKFSCRVGWHNWNPWSEPEQWTRTSYPNFIQNVWITGTEITPIESHYFRQKRNCAGCGKIQYRDV